MGGWENDETAEEAAVREAIEEAECLSFCPLLPVIHWGGERLSEYSLAAGLHIFSCRQSKETSSNCVSGFQDFIGYYEFKSKTHQDDCCPEGLCKAAMYALFVKEELEQWPERSTRTRSWLTMSEAVESCRHKWMEEALKDFSTWRAKM
ncbi:hypothetical protein POTOM_003795 [Populus tomentosa]|uniref:Nudix hydrolase domain-containing protein n=1 Tax=Populus tomentosa TaxID=118781 RepID=A0A8X8AUL1_POPTO|nr:hypothetical protein POTOM_003795 [Populus tomentosa]